jgi:tRNA pseudouridine55 synthase
MNAKKRNVHGIILLDKPIGLSSNAALQQVKRLYAAAKAGHTGSLDPLATGMLPICLGEATKVSAFLLDGDKHYETLARLGSETASGDAEGEVIASFPVPTFSRSEVETVLARFRGDMLQIPPMYSALKHQGQPLYKLARQGLEVERKAREVHIHRLELLHADPNSLRLAVECSKGTYIRTLVADIGRALGCGAHVAELRRTAAQPFTGMAMYSLQTLASAAEAGLAAIDRLLLPMDAALPQLPGVVLAPDMAAHIRQGQAVRVTDAPAAGQVRLYARQPAADEFLGVGRVLEDGRIAPQRLVFYPE